MLPTTSSVINTMSVIEIGRFIPSIGERLGMFHYHQKCKYFTDNSVDNKLGRVE